MAGRRRGKPEEEREIIEKGVSPVVAVVLLVMLTLAVAAGVWTFYTNMQRSAEEYGTAGAISTTQKTGTQVRLANVAGNRVYVQNRGVMAINRMVVYVDDRPVEPYEAPQNIYPGETGEIDLPTALEVGTHVIRVTANGVASDTLRVEGTELAKFKWRRGLMVKNPTELRVEGNWAGGSNGIPLEIERIVPLESIVVFDEERNEIPFTSSGAWWNPDWKNRQKLTIADVSGINRDDIVSFKLAGLKLATSKCQQELRVVDYKGEVMPFQTIDPSGQTATFGSQGCEIEFRVDLGSDETKNYYIYYNNPTAAEKEFETDLITTEDNAEVCVENSIIKACLGKDVGAITWFGKADGKNLLTQNSGINAYYSGVQPAVAYTAGKDYSSCAPYAYKGHRVRRAGPVETQVEYDFSTTCNDGKSYDYRYTISLFNKQPYYQLAIENLNRIDFSGSGYAYIAQTMWARQVTINSADGGGWSAYKIGDEAVGVVPIMLSARASKDSIRPTNYLKIDDSSSLEPGVISVTRTIYQGAGDPNTRVKTEAVKAATPLVYTQQAEEEQPPTSSLSINFPVTLNGKQSKVYYVYYSDEKLGIRPYTIKGVDFADFEFEISMKDEEVFRGQV